MLLALFLSLFLQDLPDGAGKAEILKVCQDCHDTSTIVSDNRTKEGWQRIIEKMIDRGSEGTDAQYETIIAYLTKNFGRINVNKATAAEIAAGVGFSAEEADAIVKYREKNGDFKDWRGLKEVVDAAKVDSKKDHIAVK